MVTDCNGQFFVYEKPRLLVTSLFYVGFYVCFFFNLLRLVWHKIYNVTIWWNGGKCKENKLICCVAEKHFLVNFYKFELISF